MSARACDTLIGPRSNVEAERLAQGKAATIVDPVFLAHLAAAIREVERGAIEAAPRRPPR